LAVPSFPPSTVSQLPTLIKALVVVGDAFSREYPRLHAVCGASEGLGMLGLVQRLNQERQERLFIGHRDVVVLFDLVHKD
jgi:hypothetical protein